MLGIEILELWVSPLEILNRTIKTLGVILASVEMKAKKEQRKEKKKEGNKEYFMKKWNSSCWIKLTVK